MICRIFHKMAEKKSPTSLMLLQGQNYLIKSNHNSFPNSLPPLLDPPTSLLESQDHHHSSIIQALNQNQNPFLIHTQQSDLKTLINPLVSQTDLYPQPTSSFPNSIDAANKDSILFKPFTSNQDFTLKELSNAIAKQCKKEPDFGTHSQLLSDDFGNMRWAERNEETARYHQSSFFGLNGGIGMPSAAVDNNVTMDAIDHVMSTEPAFKWW